MNGEYEEFSEFSGSSDFFDYEGMDEFTDEFDEGEEFSAFGDEFGDDESGEYFMDEEGDQFLGGLVGALGPVLSTVAPMAINALGSMLGNMEDGFEAEASDSQDELNATELPGLSPDNSQMAEILAAEAANSYSELEAQSLAGAAVSQVLANAPKKVKKQAPTITKAMTRVVKALRKTPQGKKIVRVIPEITKKTAATLAMKAKKGKPVTKATAIRTVAKQTKKVLGNPKRAAAAIAKNKAKQKQFNKQAIARAERLM